MPDDGSLPLHDTLLAAAAQQLSTANTLITGLTKSAQDLKESYRISRRLKVTVALGLTLMLLQVATGVVITIFALTNHSLAQRTNAVVATIKDCTDPHGKCARQGQQSTATAIAQIVARDVEGFVVVAECARTTTTDTALESCVTRRLPR